MEISSSPLARPPSVAVQITKFSFLSGLTPLYAHCYTLSTPLLPGSLSPPQGTLCFKRYVAHISSFRGNATLLSIVSHNAVLVHSSSQSASHVLSTAHCLRSRPQYSFLFTIVLPFSPVSGRSPSSPLHSNQDVSIQ